MEILLFAVLFSIFYSIISAFTKPKTTQLQPEPDKSRPRRRIDDDESESRMLIASADALIRKLKDEEALDRFGQEQENKGLFESRISKYIN